MKSKSSAKLNAARPATKKLNPMLKALLSFELRNGTCTPNRLINSEIP